MSDLMELSVLLPVYSGDDEEHLDTAITSILEQTRPPDELVIVRDGNLTPELDEVINTYREKAQVPITRVSISKNSGVGIALREGMKYCNGEYVARMDADDISVKYRFDRQIQFLQNNQEIDVVGGLIQEFTEFGDTSIRKVPTDHASIVQYARYRSPFNHVTVMMRRESVIDANNYSAMDPTEDYDLWMRMLTNGATFANIEDVLVQVRGGSDMFQRRGGIKYAWHEIRQFHKFVNIGMLCWSDFIINIILRTPVRVVPANIRKQIYYRFFRC